MTSSAMTLITMAKRELDRYEILLRVLRKEITAQKAGELVGLSKRQIQRLKKRVNKKGAKGLIHGNRGKKSNRRIPDAQRTKIAELLKEQYSDFKPTFAAEKLKELHAIDRDPKTIRSIMIAEGLWSPRQGRSEEHHRAWRKRKDAYGEMVQFDGSYHHWYEGRGESAEQCILAAIDDATSTVSKASFSAHEGVLPVFAFWKAYLLTHGKPRCIYLDKFSTYKMQHRVAMENPDLKTQFQRVCDTLGIELIFANSPQAKGRVERLVPPSLPKI
jgi:transposase